MAVQPRAQATRQAILDAAAEVFDRVGFCNAPLAHVIDRAGVGTGTFTYHFPTRELLAAALIESAETAIAEAIDAQLAQSTSTALENLIRATVSVAELSRDDRIVRVGLQLRRASVQITAHAGDGLVQERARVITAVAAAVAEGDLEPGCDPEAVGHLIFTSMCGNALWSTATGTEPPQRIVDLWRVLLAGITTDDSGRFFDQFLERLARRGE